ncbi:MAG: ActS/PrrB/RegB family redox-sensitive histidine kinase [Rhizobiaceae bacterium]
MVEAESLSLPLSRRLRLNTLIRLRWLAVIGQSVAVVVVAYLIGFPLPEVECGVLIACSAVLNIDLALRYPANHRLNIQPALALLTYDALQLSGLLYLTGGLTNPFALLMAVPVVVSATSMPVRHTVLLGGFVIAIVTLLMFFHQPLPWTPGEAFQVPRVYVAGVWFAVVSTILFTSIYAWRVADEARKLAAALAATELVLQREQHLSALDGLAAAAAHELGTPLATIALVAKEMERALAGDSQHADDVRLLRSQSERCRDILKRLTSLSAEGEAHLADMPVSLLVEEVAAPHRDFGVRVEMISGRSSGPEPVMHRNPGVLYGLGNLVENAVDFARSLVEISWEYDDSKIRIGIVDDGPGFLADMLDRIGEPYASSRSAREDAGAGGLGLGLFIAKTLLERSGATIEFSNSKIRGRGAVVSVTWTREAFEHRRETGIAAEAQPA